MRRDVNAILARLAVAVADYAAEAPELRNRLLDDVKTLRELINKLSTEKRGK